MQPTGGQVSQLDLESYFYTWLDTGIRITFKNSG